MHLLIIQLGLPTDDIGPVFDGAYEVTPHAKGVVNDKRNTVLVGDLKSNLGSNGGASWTATYLGQSRQVRDDVFGVADALRVDRLRLFVDSCSKIRWVCTLNKFHPNVEFLEEY